MEIFYFDQAAVGMGAERVLLLGKEGFATHGVWRANWPDTYGAVLQ